MSLRKIVPITDLQRQAGQLVTGLADSDEPLIITQRGRATAVLLSAAYYEQIEEDLARLDELELLEMVARSKADVAAKRLISHDEVKKRLARRSPKSAAIRGKRRSR